MKGFRRVGSFEKYTENEKIMRNAAREAALNVVFAQQFNTDYVDALKKKIFKQFKLEKDDLIVMISDGVSQSFEDGVWLLSMLSEEIDASGPLSNIARSILEQAKKKNERSDDMTVVAVRVA